MAVRLVDTVDGVIGASVHRARFARPHHRYLVQTALELAALVRTRPGIEWDAVLVTRAASGSSTLTRRLQVVDADHAATLLEVALELRLDALRRRLPLFEAASADAAAAWRPIDEMLLDDDDRGRVHGDLADPDTAFVWQQVSRAELDRHQLRPEELARRLWLAIGRFVTVEVDKSSRSAS